jgi:hypothetical protein
MVRKQLLNETKKEYVNYLVRRKYEDLDLITRKILLEDINYIWEEAQKELLEEIEIMYNSDVENDFNDFIKWKLEKLSNNRFKKFK